MREGPDIALVGALIGDPARANMLLALMSGMALTAGELAREAGVGAATASFHLAKLEAAGLVSLRKQGRHRYVELAGPDVAAAIESLIALSAVRGPRRVRPGPKDEALRRARVCYDHLAGDAGVRLLDRLSAGSVVERSHGSIKITDLGWVRLTALGLQVESLKSASDGSCRPCLDWSARRDHLGGPLGRALLRHFTDRGWVRRDPQSRVVDFSDAGWMTIEAWLEGVPVAEVEASL